MVHSEGYLRITSYNVCYTKLLRRPVTLEESCVDEKLKAYHWPGNVRELENVIQRAILMSNSEKISADMISFDMPMENQADNNAEEISSYIHKFNGSPLKGIVEEVEREVIMFRLSHRITSYNVCYTKLLRSD